MTTLPTRNPGRQDSPPADTAAAVAALRSRGFRPTNSGATGSLKPVAPVSDTAIPAVKGLLKW
jgi:hypothetical protein